MAWASGVRGISSVPPLGVRAPLELVVAIHPILIQQGPEDTCDALEPDVYAQIAQGSGGAVHSMSRNDVAKLAKQFSALGAAAGHRKLVVLDSPNAPGGAAVNKAGGSDYSFLLDSSSSTASVVVTGSMAVELVRPSGVAVAEGAPNISKTVLNAEVLYELSMPEAGRWSVRAEGALRGLHVTSDSSLQITAVDFVELRGRPGHEGFFRFTGDR